MGQRRTEITIHVAEPTSGQLESGRFAWSGVIVVDGERLARVAHNDRGTRYALFKVPDAAAKWARVERTAEGTLVGAFAPLDEFVGMLWAAAMEEISRADPEYLMPPERHLCSLKCVPSSWASPAAARPVWH